jgi:hypothetical protein
VSEVLVRCRCGGGTTCCVFPHAGGVGQAQGGVPVLCGAGCGGGGRPAAGALRRAAHAGARTGLPLHLLQQEKPSSISAGNNTQHRLSADILPDILHQLATPRHAMLCCSGRRIMTCIVGMCAGDAGGAGYPPAGRSAGRRRGAQSGGRGQWRALCDAVRRGGGGGGWAAGRVLDPLQHAPWARSVCTAWHASG